MAPRTIPSEPEILAFQRRVDSFYPPDAVNAAIAQQRAWYDDLCRSFDAPKPDGMRWEDGTVAGPAGPIPIRTYRPARITTDTAVLYLHGGGFVVGGIASHDAICAELADAAGAELVAVEYRLAPEHRHPAAFEDCRAVMEALAARGRKLVAAGDSAGGNLAAGCAAWARDAGLPAVIGQALVYPGLGGERTRGSPVEMAETLALTAADVEYYRAIYAAPEDDGYAHPLRLAEFRGLPPAFVSVAHFDPLRDDGRDYAARLAAAGVNVAFREEKQMVHAWLRARHMSPGARAGFAALCDGVRRLARGEL